MTVSTELAELTSVAERISDASSRKAIELVSELIAQIHSELLLKIEREVDLAVCSSLRRRALHETSVLSQQIAPTIPQPSQMAVENTLCKPVEVPTPVRKPSTVVSTVDILSSSLKEVSSVGILLEPWDTDMQSAAARLTAGMQAKDEITASDILPGSWSPLPAAPPMRVNAPDARSQPREGISRVVSAPWSPLFPMVPTADILPPYGPDCSAHADDGQRVCSSDDQRGAAESLKCQQSASFPLWMQFGYSSIVQAHEAGTAAPFVQEGTANS